MALQHICRTLTTLGVYNMVERRPSLSPWSQSPPSPNTLLQYCVYPPEPLPPLPSIPSFQPSVRSVSEYTAWIDGIPGQTLSPTQIAALEQYNELKAATIPTSLDTAELSATAQRMFRYLDHLLFGGTRRDRCSITIQDLTNPELRGRCRRIKTNYNNQRVLECIIEVNPNSSAHPNGFSIDDLEDTVVHEMSHGSIMLDLDSRSFTPSMFIRLLGITGHGELFVRLIRAANAVLTKHVPSSIDRHGWLH